VLNAADQASALLAEVMASAGDRAPRCSGYLPEGAEPCLSPVELAASGTEPSEDGSRVLLAPSPLADALGGALELGVPGAFQVDNGLAAALAAHVAGFPPAAITRGLSSFAGVPGRFEIVSRRPLAIVDFAHTPDALARVLQSAGELARRRGGRLGCVFGCGGERDADKRPQMGAVADRLADVVWLTTDNPRRESPEDIARMVRSGATGMARWRELPPRAEAIADAAGWAADVDVVVIAGRGHETHQELAGGPTPLSDREVARLAFSGSEGGA